MQMHDISNKASNIYLDNEIGRRIKGPKCHKLESSINAAALPMSLLETKPPKYSYAYHSNL